MLLFVVQMLWGIPRDGLIGAWDLVRQPPWEVGMWTLWVVLESLEMSKPISYNLKKHTSKRFKLGKFPYQKDKPPMIKISIWTFKLQGLLPTTSDLLSCQTQYISPVSLQKGGNNGWHGISWLAFSAKAVSMVSQWSWRNKLMNSPTHLIKDPMGNCRIEFLNLKCLKVGIQTFGELRLPSRRLEEQEKEAHEMS